MAYKIFEIKGMDKYMAEIATKLKSISSPKPLGKLLILNKASGGVPSKQAKKVKKGKKVIK